MPNNSLRNVRILTVEEIAREWYRERSLGRSEQTILAELKRAVELFQSGRDWRTEGLPEVSTLTQINQFPDRSDSWELTKQDLREFCEKQGWDLPRFWFPDDAVTRPRGRPSNKAVILAKFRERKVNGETLNPKIAEARWLKSWSISNGLQSVQDKTVARWIASEYSRPQPPHAGGG